MDWYFLVWSMVMVGPLAASRPNLASGNRVSSLLWSAVVSHTDTEVHGVACAATEPAVVPSTSVAATAAATVARDVIGPSSDSETSETELEQLPALTAKQPPLGSVNGEPFRVPV
jgi:hypothetical protein